MFKPEKEVNGGRNGHYCIMDTVESLELWNKHMQGSTPLCLDSRMDFRKENGKEGEKVNRMKGW